MHESLDGARAVVSGAADGIGRAIVLDFVRRGAVVHGLDRNLDALMRLDEIVTAIPGRPGDSCRITWISRTGKPLIAQSR